MYKKMPMVNDIKSNLDALANHDLIAALAGDEAAVESVRLHSDHPIDPSLPDHLPPADEFLVLNADSSQNEAINAALSGHSFVLQGPPGTGKSQTISNLIATMMAHGKRVLFVAEKRAAIDAVVKRLTYVGLDRLRDGPPRRGVLPQEPGPTTRPVTYRHLRDPCRQPARTPPALAEVPSRAVGLRQGRCTKNASPGGCRISRCNQHCCNWRQQRIPLESNPSHRHGLHLLIWPNWGRPLPSRCSETSKTGSIYLSLSARGARLGQALTFLPRKRLGAHLTRVLGWLVNSLPAGRFTRGC